MKIRIEMVDGKRYLFTRNSDESTEAALVRFCRNQRINRALIRSFTVYEN